MTERLQEAIKGVLAAEYRTCPVIGGGEHRCYPLTFEAMHELRAAYAAEEAPAEQEKGERD